MRNLRQCEIEEVTYKLLRVKTCEKLKKKKKKKGLLKKVKKKNCTAAYLTLQLKSPGVFFLFYS